jgi:hypothetical protein
MPQRVGDIDWKEDPFDFKDILHRRMLVPSLDI